MPHPPFIILDEENDAPLYRQIYETIRRSILSGEFYSGKQLPPSRSLAKQLGVSRMTVINAYDQLLAEGYLESRTGAGTFVAEHLPEEFLDTPPVKKKSPNVNVAPRSVEFSGYGKNVAKQAGKILQNNGATADVPFQHGLAAIDNFPFEVWNKLAREIYQTAPRGRFGYDEPGGYLPLREAIAAYLKSFRAVNCTAEQIIITGGAQSAFDLIGKVFLEPKAEILMENPVYTGAKEAFQAFQTQLIAAPVDRYGINLPPKLKRGQNIRLVYVTPSHQFPLGATMSLARRLRLLEWARENKSWIVEDDYDSEFRYEGRPLASLQGLDRDGRVLYVGTFSKTIFPALRLGCLVVPPDLIQVFAAMRVLSGSPSSFIEQATLAAFLDEGHFTRHIRRMRRLYEDRQAFLLAEAKKRLGNRLEIKKSVSGMHVIGWLPKNSKDTLAAEQAARFGVKTAALSSYFFDEPERGGLILGYAAFGEEQIKKGIAQLAKALKELN